jgi:hypothetical protein
MKRLIFVVVFFTEKTASVVSIEATPLINHKNRFALIGLEHFNSLYNI